MNTTALVTIAIGAKHAGLWETHCRRNWEAYADRVGYDLIVIDEPLDRSPRAAARSPTWQKCLILGQPFTERYERIVWMDSDILISPAAPPLADGVPPDRVGAVDEYRTPSREGYAQALRKLYRHWEATGMDFARNERAREFYVARGLPGRHDSVVQPGVLVFSPSHREILERVYENHEEQGGATWGEWGPLSFELLEADAVAWLDHRFNYPWPIYKALHFPFLLNHPDDPRAGASATAAFGDVHCLHFAGSHHEIALVDQDAEGPCHVPHANGRRPSRRLGTPVALFAFARPDTTKRVLASIREARPRQLLVVADAPPADSPELAARCAEVRGLVETIDWDCELLTHYADRHMGLNRRVESGLGWVFDIVEEAIVLEDDCRPHPSFFRFCAEALAHHRDDPGVTTISGDNFDFAAGPAGPSYRYSRYPLIWGWATWRRAWRAHDPRMSRWPELREAGWLEQLFDDPHAVAYWGHHFDQTHRGEGSWDYAWTFSSWTGGGLSVTPAVNLVSNIGFGSEATHTRDDDLSPFANLDAGEMRFPLRHPTAVAPDREADRLLEDVLFSGNVHRMFERLRRVRRARQAAG